ncbi:MAG: fibronectin type III domain-containing protein [Candidatus Roizmanbacteria bacterium]|nr:fibronectin type III domain-containing protein [Candidatus Roizmanbacteria bacterium]
MKFPSIKSTAAVKIAIGVVASIVVVVGGFLLVQNVFTKASDSAPRDLIITGISTNTAKVAWTTDQETQGVVEYGSSPTSLNLFAPESQKQKNHSVEITLLSPSTSYYFQIRIGETKFDNGGVPWTFSTKAQSSVITGSPTPPVTTGGATLIPTPIGPTTSGSAFGQLKGSSLKVVPTLVPTIPVAIPSPTIYAVCMWRN